MANKYVVNDVVGFCLGEENPRINFRPQRYFTIGHN